jgi:hypothetical protein
MATTIDRLKENPQFDINTYKLPGSEPLNVYIKMAFAWLLQKIVSGLVWFGKFLFRWTIELLADIVFNWTPKFFAPSVDLYGKGVAKLCGYLLTVVVLSCLVIIGILKC